MQWGPERGSVTGSRAKRRIVPPQRSDIALYAPARTPRLLAPWRSCAIGNQAATIPLTETVRRCHCVLVEREPLGTDRGAARRARRTSRFDLTALDQAASEHLSIRAAHTASPRETSPKRFTWWSTECASTPTAVSTTATPRQTARMTATPRSEALYWGSSTQWSRGGGSGPWVAADLENGMFEGDSTNTPSNIPV